MNGYGFAVSCLKCGEPVEPVTDSVGEGGETKTICKCVQCKKVWLLSVYMQPIDYVGKPSMPKAR